MGMRKPNVTLVLTPTFYDVILRMRNVNLHVIYGTPSISLDWIKLDTTNLVCRCDVANTNRKKDKMSSKRGVARVT